ncbi:MAG: DNA adenine methylase [Bacteroidota bacterium]|nr:DNA adenine methylase [Bacteroidota bacterium]
MISVKQKRPLLRYHGGKFLLAPWIIGHFPKHKVYVEPFGGAASVLLQKPRAYAEVYNDMDSEIVNLFKVVRTEGEKLKELLELTPFSRDEFLDSYTPSDDPLEQARRTVIRSFMGFGSAGATRQKTGFRSNSNRSGTTPAHDWKNYPEALHGIIERLKGVVIENRDAKEVMISHDADNALHYVDPPYVLSTRYQGEKTKCYNYEMQDSEHVELLGFLKQLNGCVVLSGYDNEMYNDLLKDWRRVHRKAYGDGAVERTEVLWINREQKTDWGTLWSGI